MAGDAGDLTRDEDRSDARPLIQIALHHPAIAGRIPARVASEQPGNLQARDETIIHQHGIGGDGPASVGERTAGLVQTGHNRLLNFAISPRLNHRLSVAQRNAAGEERREIAQRLVQRVRMAPGLGEAAEEIPCRQRLEDLDDLGARFQKLR